MNPVHRSLLLVAAGLLASPALAERAALRARRTEESAMSTMDLPREAVFAESEPESAPEPAPEPAPAPAPAPAPEPEFIKKSPPADEVSLNSTSSTSPPAKWGAEESAMSTMDLPPEAVFAESKPTPEPEFIKKSPPAKSPPAKSPPAPSPAPDPTTADVAAALEVMAKDIEDPEKSTTQTVLDVLTELGILVDGSFFDLDEYEGCAAGAGFGDACQCLVDASPGGGLVRGGVCSVLALVFDQLEAQLGTMLPTMVIGIVAQVLGLVDNFVPDNAPIPN